MLARFEHFKRDISYTGRFYLLLCVYKSSTKTAGQIHIIHLSVVEKLMNFFEAVRRIPDFITLSIEDANILKEIQNYVQIMMFAGISIVYYLDMIYLTLDKLLEIMLNIRYPLYWSTTKSNVLMSVTWLFAGILVTSISLLHHLTEYNWEEHIFKYCFPILNFSFIMIAVTSYGFIFHRFKHAQNDPAINLAPRARKIGTVGPIPRVIQGHVQPNVFRLIRKSRFLTIFLLIITFILFIVVPDSVYLCQFLNGQESEALNMGCWISYAIGNLADCYIYIFMQPALRKQFVDKMLSCRRP